MPCPIDNQIQKHHAQNSPTKKGTAPHPRENQSNNVALILQFYFLVILNTSFFIFRKRHRKHHTIWMYLKSARRKGMIQAYGSAPKPFLFLFHPSIPPWNGLLQSSINISLPCMPEK